MNSDLVSFPSASKEKNDLPAYLGGGQKEEEEKRRGRKRRDTFQSRFRLPLPQVIERPGREGGDGGRVNFPAAGRPRGTSDSSVVVKLRVRRSKEKKEKRKLSRFSPP